MPVMAPQSFNKLVKLKNRPLEAMFEECNEDGWEETWLCVDLFILVAGLKANISLLWLFMWEKKSLSATKVLGLNLVVMDLMYLSIMPMSVIYKLVEQEPGTNGWNVSVSNTSSQNPNAAEIMEQTRQIFSMFNLIGCPLLLTCMCIERHLAVFRPVLYLRVRKWEYRMAVSAVVWTFTLSFCLTTGLTQDMTVMMVPVSVIISCLFLIMLACLGSMVWSLEQQSPAHATHGHQSRCESPLKRRAVCNLLVVMVPSVIAYCPMLAIAPLYFYITYGNKSLNRVICYGLELSAIFPTLGVLIGPLFYFSKARQMCCLSGTGKTFNE